MESAKDMQMDTTQMEQRNQIRTGIRLLLAIYVGYIILQLIHAFVRGNSGISAPVLLCATTAMIVAEGAVILLTLRKWKEKQQRIRLLRAARISVREETADR